MNSQRPAHTPRNDRDAVELPVSRRRLCGGQAHGVQYLYNSNRHSNPNLIRAFKDGDTQSGMATLMIDQGIQ